MESINDIEYHKCFINYLKHTRAFRTKPEGSVQSSALGIEKDLDTIFSQCDILYTSIYEIKHKNYLLQLRSETNSGGKLNNLNSTTNGRLRESIDYYIGFLGSKYHPLAECSLKVIHSEKKKEGEGPTLKNGGASTSSKTTTSKIKFTEGGKLQVRDSEIYNRNPKAREECIKAHNSEYKCMVCGMNFVQAYGEIGKEFIEVHHLCPISQTDGKHEIDPAKDLIPLCSNCHSMIHRMKDPSDWQGLKELFDSSRNA